MIFISTLALICWWCQSLRTACEERDSRISALEVQALRNTATLKMLSSALEVKCNDRSRQFGFAVGNLGHDVIQSAGVSASLSPISAFNEET